MFELIALILGIAAGILQRRKIHPLMLERWRVWPLIPVMLAACLLPSIFSRFWPDLLWTADRSLLIALLIFPFLIALVLIFVNVLPNRFFPSSQPPILWYHRTALLIIAAGLIVEAAVLMLNHGYMPIPDSYLDNITDISTIVGIRNQALYMKQLIGPDTVLPWLGQIWRADWLTFLKLSPFPYISPGETIISIGLFLTGFSHFYTPKPKTQEGK